MHMGKRGLILFVVFGSGINYFHLRGVRRTRMLQVLSSSCIALIRIKRMVMVQNPVIEALMRQHGVRVGCRSFS
jgi:hypothetical protein